MAHVDNALVRRAQWSAAYADVMFPNSEVIPCNPGNVSRVVILRGGALGQRAAVALETSRTHRDKAEKRMCVSPHNHGRSQ